MLYRGMDRTQLDAAYNNTAAVPERGAIVADWAARSATVRREHAGHLDLPYGDSARERLDLFLAANPKAPTLAFIHGGYRQIFRWMGGHDEMLSAGLAYANVAFAGAVSICLLNLLGSAVRG